MEETVAKIHELPKPAIKSSPAVREILLGWLEACITSEITILEIKGVVDGEDRQSSYAIIPAILPEGYTDG